MPDRLRTAHREYVPHLGAGDRRIGAEYQPKFTHEDLDRYVDELLRRLDDSGYDVGVIDFGDAGVLTGYSKSYYPLREATLAEVYGSLSVPGTTDTVAVVNLNGAAVGTLTIPAGQTFASLVLSVDFAPTDRWQMNVTTAGAGAQGATFYGRFD